MSEGRIDSVIIQEAIQREFDFMNKNIDQLIAKIQTFSQLKISFQGAENIKQLSQAQNELSNNVSAYQKLQQQIITSQQKLTALQSDYGKALAEVKLQQQQVNAANKDAAKEALGLNDAYTKLSNQYKEAAKAARALAAEALIDPSKQKQAEEASQKAFQLGAALKSIDAGVNDFRRNVGNYEGSAKIITDAFERSKQKVESLNKSLGPTSPEAQAARREFEALQRITDDPQFLNIAAKIGDNRTEIRFFTNQLDELRQRGLETSDAFKEIQARLAELTRSTKETRESIKALSSETRGFDLFASSVNFLASTYEVAAGAASAFGKDSEEATKKTRELVAVIALANGVREIARQLTEKGTAANKLYNFVLDNTKIAFDSTSAAGTRWASVLKLGIAGLVVGAILFLIRNIDDLTGANKRFEKSIDAIPGITQDAKDRLKEYGDTAEKVAQGVLKELTSQINSLNSELGKSPQTIEDAQNAISALNDELVHLILLQTTGVSQNFFEVLVDKLSLGTESKKKIAETEKSIQDLENSITRLKALQAEQSIRTHENADLENFNRTADLQIDANNRVLNNERSNLQERLNAIKSNYAQTLQIIENNRQKEINNANGDKLKENEAIFKANADRTKAERDLQEQLQKIKDQYADRDRQAQFNILSLDKKFIIDNAKSIADDEKKTLEERLQAQETMLLEGRRQIIAEAEFEKQKRGLTATEIEAIEAKSIDAQLRLMQDFRKGVGKIIDETLKDVQPKLEDFTGNFEKAANKINENILNTSKNFIQKANQDSDDLKKTLDDLATAWKNLGKTIEQGFISVVEGSFDRQKNDLQDQINQIDLAKDAQIQKVNSDLLSEQEKADKIATINAVAQAKKDQLQKRQQQIDRQKAIFDRAAKIFEITTDTITQVNKIRLEALAAINPAIKAALITQAIIAAATGAASIATLIATPIPKYGSGTESAKGGISIVAEKGRELAIDPHGRMIMYDRPTITNLVRGTKIIPNNLTEMIIAGRHKELSEKINWMNGFKNISIENNRDLMEKTLSEIKRLNKKPGIIIHIDRTMEARAEYDRLFKH